MNRGLIEAITGAIGQADNEIGGLTQTRLTEAVQPVTELAAVYTWDGTVIVTTPDTSEVTVGDWISLESEKQFYQVVDVTANVSVEIDNPSGFTIPTSADPSLKITRSLPVESALDWDDEGAVGVAGILYRYGSRTDYTLDEITHLLGGVSTPGVKKLHRVDSTVIELNRNKTALDLVRRALLVDYAEGDDLNNLGRNLGVDRLPFIGDDEVFREIIKALAYNPKGTVFGLELALRALVGDGNFEVFEDLITDPCTVFVKLSGAAITNDTSFGKAFLSGDEFQPAASDTSAVIDNPIALGGSVGSVRWKNEAVFTDSRLSYPSADIITEYETDPGNPAWWLAGTGVSEGSDTTLAGDATEFTLPAPTDKLVYRRDLRLQPESYLVAGALITVPTGAPVDASIVSGMLLDDGEQGCAVGIFAVGAATFQVGFVSGGSFIGSGLTLQRDTYYEITVKKSGRSDWELYVNGQLVETVGYTLSVATTGGYYFEVGHLSVGASSNQLRMKHLTVWVKTTTDYWSGRRTDGAVNVANPDQLNTTVPFFDLANDVGKLLTTKNSGITNPQGGNNNGSFYIASLISNQIAQLAGPSELGASTNTANPKRITLPTTGRQLQFPDDLGKEIVLTGSSLGNNGSYVIEKLLQDGTYLDLGSLVTVVPEKTNIVEVVAASLVTEANLGWQINPIFATEPNVEWEMSAAGDWTGTTINLRQALPIPAGSAHRVLAIVYSNVLSAQLLLDPFVVNQLIQEFPDLLFAYYPFYIADPLGFIRSYVNAITAAGVIPDFIVE